MILTAHRVIIWIIFCLVLIGAIFLFGRSVPQNEGLLLYEPMIVKKKEVEKYWQQYGNFKKESPTIAAGYEDYGFLISVSDRGVIRGQNESGTIFINLRPKVSGDKLLWECDGSKVGGIPSGCR